MHEQVRGLLPEYAAGGLDAATRRRVDAHLAGCAACRAELLEWRALAGALEPLVAGRAAAVPAWTPPPMPVAPPSGSIARRPRSGARLLLLALAIAIGSIGLRWRGTTRPILPDVGSDGGSARAGRALAPDDQAAPRHVDRLPTPVARSGSGSSAPVRVVERGPEASVHGASGHGPDSTGAPGHEPGRRDRPSTATPVGEAVGPAGTTATSGPPSGASGAEPGTPAPKSTPEPEPTRTPSPETSEATPTPFATATGVPSPTRATTTWLRGNVYGPDGFPRAEISVLADRLDVPAPAVAGSTDLEGRYALALPPGRWLLRVDAPAYQPMWHAGQANPYGADPIELDLGDDRRVDFHLEPNPPWQVEGRVLDAFGAPASQALVLAAYPPDPDRPGEAPRRAWAVFTGPDGRFALALPPGAWYLAASPDWRSVEPSWWGGDGSLEQADRLGIGAQPTTSLELRLRP